MTEKSEPTPKIDSPWQLAAWYAGKHGGLVFGLLATLAIWVIMVQPELTRNAFQNEVLRQALEEVRNHADDQEDIAEHLKTTAEILDRITLRLNGHHVAQQD